MNTKAILLLTILTTISPLSTLSTQASPSNPPTRRTVIDCEESALQFEVINDIKKDYYELAVRTIYADFYDRLPLKELGMQFDAPHWYDRIFKTPVGWIEFSISKNDCQVKLRDVSNTDLVGNFEDLFYFECGNDFFGPIEVAFTSGYRQRGVFYRTKTIKKSLEVSFFNRLVFHKILTKYHPTSDSGALVPTDGGLTDVDGQLARVHKVTDRDGNDVFRVDRNSYGPVFRFKNDHFTSWDLFPTWISYERCNLFPNALLD